MTYERPTGNPELDPLAYNLPTEVRLLDRQDENLFLSELPIALLRRGDVAVDPHHVYNLAQAMRTQEQNQARGGQLQTGLVVQVTDVEEPYLGLADGFHRTAAHELNGHRTFYATLKTGGTREELIDLRIISATTHRPVSFSRIAEWVMESWELTEWSQRGFNIGQAFSLVVGPGVTGERMGFTPEDVEDVKAWVLNKCRLWNKSENSIYQHLTIAQKAAPDLVRITMLGIPQKGELSKTQLKTIADALPFDFDLQRRVAAIVTESGLASWQTVSLAYAVSQAQTPEDVEELLSRDWTVKPEPEPTSHRSRPSAYQTYDETPRSESFRGEERDRSYDRPSPSEARLDEMYDRIWELTVANANLKVDNAYLRGTIQPRMSAADTRAASPVAEEESLGADFEQIRPTDADLENFDPFAAVTKAQAGDTRGIDSYFVNVMYPKLIRYVSRKLQGLSHLEPEDIVQDVWERFMTTITRDTFTLQHSLESVAFRITTNLVIDNYRRQNSHGEALELDERLVATEGQTEEQVFAELLATDPRLRRIILGLTDDQREAVILKYCLGYQLSNAEIGQVMTNSEGGVKSLLHRAKDTIQRELGIKA